MSLDGLDMIPDYQIKEGDDTNDQRSRDAGDFGVFKERERRVCIGGWAATRGNQTADPRPTGIQPKLWFDPENVSNPESGCSASTKVIVSSKLFKTMKVGDRRLIKDGDDNNDQRDRDAGEFEKFKGSERKVASVDGQQLEETGQPMLVRPEFSPDYGLTPKIG